MSEFNEKKENGEQDVLGLDEVEGPVVPFNLINKSTGVSFLVPNKKWVNVSKVIVAALEDDPEAVCLPLDIDHDRSDELLAYIVQYMILCKGMDIPLIPKPLSSKLMVEVMKRHPYNAAEPFEHLKFATFIDTIGDLDKQVLYHLIEAANKLNIQGLMHLGLAKVCTWIKGHPIGELKEKLLPNKYNPDGTLSSEKLTEFRPHTSVSCSSSTVASCASSAAATSCSSSAAATVEESD
jgi:hypothetical protein